MSLVEGMPAKLRPEAQPAGRTPMVVGVPKDIKPRYFSSFNAFLKRCMDIAIASILLILLSPSFIFVGLLVSLDGGPIIFRHKRLGRNLEVFECLKFRSMMHGDILEEYLQYNLEAAAEWKRDHKLAVDPRITSIGKYLRATSLDELPQLMNVLRGDMSLVGPRPITLAETAFYGQFLSSYASVRPGITGLWQVSGRSEVDYVARVALDRCYASINNILMDLAILVRTPMAVFSRQGAR